MVDVDRVVDGSAIVEGDSVVGVASSGLHSNGYTLARSVLQARHSLGDRMEELGSSLGDALLTPTRIYVKPALEVLERREIHGLAHITGGAFTKLKRLVGQRRLEFALELPPTPPVFGLIQREGRLTDLDMLRTFNMGVGLCVCAPRDEVDSIVRTFARRGFPAFPLGTVRRGSGVVVGGLRVEP